MASLGLTSACSRPSAVAASCSSRQLRSSASKLSQGIPLVAAQPRTSALGGAAASTRDRASVRVEALLGNKKWWEIKSPPNVVHIGSVQQLVDAMSTAGDRLVIIDFFAPWCAACKGLYPKMMTLMEERPDVLLLAVNFDENKTLVKALGVKVLPYFMFYRGADGKLEGFSASGKRIHLIQDAIERHTSPRCYLEGERGPVLREFPNVSPSSKGRLSSSSNGSGASVPQAPPAIAEPQPVA